MLRDFELLEWIGANSSRTSHYPYASDVMGLLRRPGHSGHRRNPGDYELGCPAASSAPVADLRDIQRTDDRRRRPAVAWPDDPRTDRPGQEPPVRHRLVARQSNRRRTPRPPRSLAAVRHRLQADVGNLVGFANVMLVALHGKCRVSQFSDILMLNRYYGWYVNNGDLPAAQNDMTTELAPRAGDGKPISHDRVRRRHLSGQSTRRRAEPWSEDYQVAYPEANAAAMDATDAVIGEQDVEFRRFRHLVRHREWVVK